MGFRCCRALDARSGAGSMYTQLMLLPRHLGQAAHIEIMVLLALLVCFIALGSLEAI